MSNFDTVTKIPESVKEFSVTCHWSFMQLPVTEISKP